MQGKLIAGALALILAVPANAQNEGPTETFGNFRLRTITDPMTDASRGILVSNTETIKMVVKCDKNGPGSLYVSFDTDHYLDTFELRPVIYRLDSAPPATVNAYHLKTAAVVHNVKRNSAAGRWFGSLFGASKLTVQVRSFDHDTYTQVIDLTGFREGAARAAAICRDPDWYGAARAPTIPERG